MSPPSRIAKAKVDYLTPEQVDARIRELTSTTATAQAEDRVILNQIREKIPQLTHEVSDLRVRSADLKTDVQRIETSFVSLAGKVDLMQNDQKYVQTELQKVSGEQERTNELILKITAQNEVITKMQDKRGPYLVAVLAAVLSFIGSLFLAHR